MKEQAREPTAIARAVEIAGGLTAMTRRLGMKNPQAVYEWVKYDRVPAARVLAIETAVDGAVTRHQLRPDLYPSEAAA
jgi:DNA-binding transcriptional regulator YdaS (Cro superfamily)